jgi:hypothetical protein
VGTDTLEGAHGHHPHKMDRYRGASQESRLSESIFLHREEACGSAARVEETRRCAVSPDADHTAKGTGKLGEHLLNILAWATVLSRIPRNQGDAMVASEVPHRGNLHESSNTPGLAGRDRTPLARGERHQGSTGLIPRFLVLPCIGQHAHVRTFKRTAEPLLTTVQIPYPSQVPTSRQDSRASGLPPCRPSAR